VLLAGPHGVGKSMLVDAACTHVDATLFDLSHASLLARYPGKAGMVMLIHLIVKMSKLLQPSVILIEDVERVYMKKSGGRSAQRWDMRRMRKELPKIVRSVVVDDRVLLVGTTTTPWECEQRVYFTLLHSLFRLSEQFQSRFRVSEQFQSSIRAISEFQSSFRAVSEQY